MNSTVCTRPRLLVGILALLALLLALPPCAARPAPKKPKPSGMRVSPDVYWVSVTINGRRCGFGRGEYTRGEAAPYQFQLLILFNSGGFRHAHRLWSEFGGDLRPVNFYQKTSHWKGGSSLTNTADGVFHHDRGKLLVEYDEYKTHEKVEVPIPANVVAQSTQELILAREKLSPGRTFSFRIYDVKGRRFAVQRYRVASWDAGQRAWRIEQTSDAEPGSTSTIWFQTASAKHPNGWTLRALTPGANRAQIEMKAATREQAIEGFEREAAALGI